MMMSKVFSRLSDFWNRIATIPPPMQSLPNLIVTSNIKSGKSTKRKPKRKQKMGATLKLKEATALMDAAEAIREAAAAKIDQVKIAPLSLRTLQQVQLHTHTKNVPSNTSAVPEKHPRSSLPQHFQAQKSIEENIASKNAAKSKLVSVKSNSEAAALCIVNQIKCAIDESFTRRILSACRIRFLTIHYMKKIYMVCAIDGANFNKTKQSLIRRLGAFGAQLANPNTIFNFNGTIEASMTPKQSEVFKTLKSTLNNDLQLVGGYNVDIVSYSNVLTRFNCSPFKLETIAKQLMERGYLITNVDHEFAPYKTIDLDNTEMLTYYRFVRSLFNKYPDIIHFYDNVNHPKALST